MTDRLRDRIAAAFRAAVCNGDCGDTEEECARQRIQPYVWHHGVLVEVLGSPEVFAQVALATLLAGTEREPRTRLDDLTSNQLDRLYDDLDRHDEILTGMNERVIELEQRAAAAEAEVRWYAEADSADAAAGSYAGRAEAAEAALAEARRLHRMTCPLARGDVKPAAFGCSMCETLDQPAPGAVNPPGSTREQLPPAVLALLPIHPYLSTACQTADAVAITAVRGLPLYDELRAHAERLHGRCRLNHKFTGQLCTCGCHGAEETATNLEPVVHACPPDGSGIMPCCGRTPFETPGDRITMNPNNVTCRACLRAVAAPAPAATEATDTTKTVCDCPSTWAGLELCPACPDRTKEK